MAIDGKFYYSYNYNAEILKKINNFGLITNFNIDDYNISTYTNDIKFSDWKNVLSEYRDSHFLIINFEKKLFLHLRRSNKRYVDIIQLLKAKNIRTLKIEKLL